MSSQKNIIPIQVIPFEPLTQAPQQTRRTLSAKWTGIFALCLFLLLFFAFTFFARAVIFELEPESAELEIESLLSFNIGDNYLLLPGEHRVNASAVGYSPYQQKVLISSKKNQRIPLTLQPLPGIVTFKSDISGIEVFLNNEKIGDVGEKIDGLPLGPQTFELKKKRYLDSSIDFEVKGFGTEQETSVSMAPAWGILSIDSLPSRAQVFVDGNELGSTPIDVEILNTGSELKLLAPNFEPWKKRLSAAPGSSDIYPTIQLEKVYTRFFIESSPSGAKVTLNGTFQGTTPLEVSAASDTAHKLNIFSQGYETISNSIKGESGKSRKLNYQLQAIYGNIALNVRPAGTEVYINDSLYKGGLNDLRLPIKQQTITFKKAGYITQEKRVTPKKNTTQILDITLLTPEQARFAKYPKTYKTAAGTSMKLMRPDATFTMGAPRREPGRRANETQRRVKLDRAFYVSLYEITNAQYREFDSQHNSKQIAGRSLDNLNHPAVNLSWNDAARFCNWLSQKENFTPYYLDDGNTITGVNEDSDGYRLPTETEWAWLARFDSNSMLRYAWGNNFPPSKVVENYNDMSAASLLGSPIASYQDNFPVSSPVGSFPANAKGIFDLGGNVSEWINDYYDVGTTHLGEPLINPTGPESGTQRIIRGASWKASGRSLLRLSFRDFGTEGREDLGFRIVRQVK